MKHQRTYLAAACDGIRRVAGLGKSITQEKFELHWLADYLETESQCWSIDKDALHMLWNTNLNSDTLAEMRLPYKTMAIEYDFLPEVLGIHPELSPGMEVCPPRVTFLIEHHAKDGAEGFLIYNSFKDPRVPFWTITPYAIFIPYSDFANVESWFSTAKGKDGGKLTRAVLVFSGLTESMSLERLCEVTGQTKDELVQTLHHEAPMINDIRVALCLLQVLACENAPVETIPAPVKLNHKRIKTGKHPIPSYRTLRISQRMLRDSGYRSESGGQHRASPRTHIRNGHIHRWRKKDGDYSRKWLPPILVNPGHGDAKPTDVKVKK